MKRPHLEDIVQVLDWLHSLQLQVYGPPLEGGGGCQDYELEDILLKQRQSIKYYNVHKPDGEICAVIAYNDKFEQNLALAVSAEDDVTVEFSSEDLIRLKRGRQYELRFRTKKGEDLAFLSEAFLYE